jgi:Xaa-Pro aminopeptidase
MEKTKNLLITNKSNIKYLSNFTGSSGFMLITTSKKYLFTDFRYIERAKKTIKKEIEIIDSTNWQKILRKHKIKTLGVEESNLTVTQYKKFKKISHIKNEKIKFTDISGMFEEKREIKTEREIELIKKSQRINEKILNELKKEIKASIDKKEEKITELKLAWKIKELANKFGADDLSFDPIVAFGENSAIPHHSPTLRKLKKTDVVLIDMGVKYKGYCSDMTRTILPKKPTKQEKEIYSIVLKAQNTAIKKIKAGITGQKADKYSREIIESAGYKENYGHSGGHGIGLDIHEIPSINENYKKKLKKNSVITIEPGIYLSGKFGVRIEDMILIKGNKAINLTKTKK